MDAATVTVTATTAAQTIAFQGNLTVTTGMSAAAGGYNVSMTGALNSVAGATTFGNTTGTLAVGDQDTDSTAFVGGVTKTAGAKNFAGTISATGTGVLNFGTAGAVSVTANATIGGTSTGQITLFTATLADGVTLTLGTGAATPITTGAISGTPAGLPSNIIINTTNTVTVGGAVGTDIGDLTLTAGTLSMTNNGLTVGGNISRTTGIITSIGTVTLNGTGPQLVNFVGSTLATLAVANTGTVTSNGSFTVLDFTKSGAGTFTVVNADTMTVSTSFTATSGTVNLTGTYSSGGATTFDVIGATVNAAANPFAAGVMTVSSGSFVQTGVNSAGTQTVIDLTVSASGTCTWDASVAGGYLLISGALSNAGTLAFNLKNVTAGTSITGAVEFYDLLIPASTTLTPGLATTITVRRNMSIGLLGSYVLTNSPALVLGGANSVSGGQYNDANAAPVSLGNLTVNGAFTKTLASHMRAGSLTVTGQTLALATHALTVDGLLSGTGTVTATGAQIVTIGGDLSVNTLTLAGSTAALQIGGSMTTPVVNFTPGSSTVTLDGAANATMLGYTFYNLTMNKAAAATTLTPSAGITVTNALTLTRGDFRAGTFTHTIAGDWNSGSAVVTFNATSSGTSTIVLSTNGSTMTMKPADSFYDLTLSRGGTMASDITVRRNLIVANAAAGSLTGSTFILNVAGDVTMTPTNSTLTANTSTLNLNGTGNQTVATNGLSWYNVTTATRAAGTITFNQALITTGTLSVVAGAYNLAINDGGSAATSVTFNNTGALALNTTIGETLTFNGGVTATAPASVTVIGTLATSADAMALGNQGSGYAVNLAGATILQTAGGGLTLGPVSGAFSLDIQAGAGTLQADGLVGSGTPLASLTLSSAGLATFALGISTSGNISLNNSGVLTLSDATSVADTASTEIVTTAGNLTQTGASSVSLAADFNLIGTYGFASPLNLSGDVLITASGLGTFGASATLNNNRAITFSGNGARVFNAALGDVTPLGNLTLNGTGAKTFVASVNLNAAAGALSVAGSTGLVTFQNTLGAFGASQANGANPVQFNGDVTLAGSGSFLGDVTLDGLTYSSVGATMFGVSAADTVTLSNATATMTGTGTKTFNGIVTGTMALNQTNGMGAMTFNENVTIAGGDFQGDVTLSGMTLTSSAPLTIGTSPLDADTLTLSTAIVTLQGAGSYTVNAAVTGTQALSMDGSGFKVFNDTVSTTAAITQIDASGSVTFAENVDLAGGAFNANVVFDGMILTTSAALALGNTDADTITLSTAAVTWQGTGNIAVNGITNGAVALNLDGNGTKNFAALAVIGGTTPLTGLTQTAGSGLLTLNANASVNGTITLNGSLTAGAMTLTGTNAAGAILIGDASADAFAVSAAVTVAGTTAGVTINATTSLSNNLTVTSGAGAILVNAPINGAQTLTLTTSGLTTLGGALGAGTALSRLNVDGAGTVNLGANIGADIVNITDAAMLTASLTLDDGVANGTVNLGGTAAFEDVRFASTAGGAFSLSLTGAGRKEFAGAMAIGAAAGSSLIQSGTGALEFLGSVSTAQGILQTGAGLITFRDTVTIAGATAPSDFQNSVVLDGLTYDSAGATTFGSSSADTITLSAGDVTLGGVGLYTVNATVNGLFDLTLNGNGIKTFNAAVGTIGDGTGASLIQAGTGAVAFVSTVSTAQGITQSGSGTITFRDNVTVIGAVTASDYQNSVVLDGLIYSSAGSTTFGASAIDTITLSAGDITLAGAGPYIVNAAVTGPRSTVRAWSPSGKTSASPAPRSLEHWRLTAWLLMPPES